MSEAAFDRDEMRQKFTRAYGLTSAPKVVRDAFFGTMTSAYAWESNGLLGNTRAGAIVQMLEWLAADRQVQADRIAELERAEAAALAHADGCAATAVLLDKRATAAEAELSELRAVFASAWEADQRAIQMWQAAAPAGEDLSRTWPDHGKMVVFLIDRLDAMERALAPFAKAAEAMNRQITPTGQLPDIARVDGITLGECRRARAALAQTTEAGDV